VQTELAVNEVLKSRQQTYIDILQKEVKAAKSILGNKHMRDQALKDLNFEPLHYYDYEPQLEAGAGEFDKDRVTIVVPTKKSKNRTAIIS
jgi:hypothetical protein